MSGKTFEQAHTLESVRDLYRRLNDYASIAHTFTKANSVQSVLHTLGRPPGGFQVLRADKPVSIYANTTPFSDRSYVYLKADNSGVTAIMRVF